MVDVKDVDLLQRALGTKAYSVIDPRDLNHDGLIDVLDVNILRGLCTKAGCAT